MMVARRALEVALRDPRAAALETTQAMEVTTHPMEETTLHMDTLLMDMVMMMMMVARREEAALLGRREDQVLLETIQAMVVTTHPMEIIQTTVIIHPMVEIPAPLVRRVDPLLARRAAPHQTKKTTILSTGCNFLIPNPQTTTLQSGISWMHPIPGIPRGVQQIEPHYRD
jgi:hypothetical protein